MIVTFDLAKMIKPTDINFLNQEELLYEIKVRGIDGTPTVNEMRNSLRSLLKLEREGHSLTIASHPYTFEEDLKSIEAKYKEIEETKKLSMSSSKDKKVAAKLRHALGRCDRSNAVELNERKVKSEWKIKLLLLMDSMDKTEKEPDEALEISGLQVLDIDSENSEDEPAANSTSVERAPLGSSINQAYTSYKMEHQIFKSDMSLNAFLQQVEDLRVARNITKEQLFASAIDLFRGQALLWFRTKRSEAKNWDNLVKLLRDEYLPSDYNDKLFEEIRRRTQEPKESISAYIVVMENLFSRLTIEIKEKVKLKVILKNLAPFYHLQLGLTQIDSISQLLKLGKQLEEKRTAVDNRLENQTI